MDLLTTHPRAFVALNNLVDERGREVRAVLEGRAARDAHVVRIRGASDEAPDDGRGPWRGSHNAPRVCAEPQPEHQLVPGVRVPPRRELVTRCRVVLLASEPVWLLGAVGERLGPVGPREARLGGLPEGTIPGRGCREDAALSLDEHIAHVGGGGAYEGDALGASSLDLTADPLHHDARLTGAATCEDQPDPPVTLRNELAVASPEVPVVLERLEISCRQALDRSGPLTRCQRCE